MPLNKPIKILLISSYFHPHVGGSQRYMEELYFHLCRRHPEISVDVLAYNTDKAPKEESYRGFTIYRIPCWEIIRGRFALPNPFVLYSILQKLASNKYDYVHTHLRFFDQTWWGWIYAKSIGAKCIFTEHVAITPVHQSKLIELIVKIVDVILAPFAIKKYDIVTATNTPAKKLLEKMGVTKPVQLVYGGVDTEFFTPQKSIKKVIPRANKVFPRNSVVITYIGRLIWTKGVTYLYEAIKKLNPQLSTNIYFVIAGDGELFPMLSSQIQEDNLQDRVYLTGNLNPQEVRELLRITDIFVYPSHHNEGFPNAILEAGSSGCFVIATDNAGTSEIVTHGKNGLLIKQKKSIEIEKALMWALANSKKSKEMGINLREKIREKFDWTNISEEYYKFITPKID